MNRNFTFVIIDDNQNTVLKTKAIAESFQNFSCVGTATNYEDGMDCVLEKNPAFIFLEINPEDKDSNLSLGFINELYRYFPVIPKVIITSRNSDSAFDAIKHGVYDYLIKPVEQKEFRKTIARLNRDFNAVSPIVSAISSEKEIETEIEESISNFDNEETTDHVIIEPVEIVSDEATDLEEKLDVVQLNAEDKNNSEVTFSNVNSKDKPLTICVKSYGDYRYINANDVCYLQADNNSTDIHLASGEMITAFKTLKHFESVLKYPFVRIHNSYIVNIDYVSRIHTGNAVCHIKDTTTKLPFSKSYKENIDAIINTIASGNYLEI
ncbi:LytR/AlgR family response regulator transcription factor [Flavobacterium sp.]|uniref:LytR/AlgR family response regulator transcription factor n=1 Tax=Flavobacterium sp. TaxID=239 RepID=UPI002B4AFD48|nr:LytTR family transcriptional regulator DNA-binding domain-containing protein [Flavobacterium sp.]HLP63409.1 LytTR family transcriptional regulator DNA-binding domain-containing protein [Flavobacterium sp.]